MIFRKLIKENIFGLGRISLKLVWKYASILSPNIFDPNLTYPAACASSELLRACFLTTSLIKLKGEKAAKHCHQALHDMESNFCISESQNNFLICSVAEWLGARAKLEQQDWCTEPGIPGGGNAHTKSILRSRSIMKCDGMFLKECVIHMQKASWFHLWWTKNSVSPKSALLGQVMINQIQNTE